ncbi:MAG: FAD-binding oxidoreductase [Candidatus Woesearchaeota archaeon]
MNHQTVQEYNLKIIKIIDEAPSVKTFRVQTPKEISFLPSQFFMVRFEGNPKLQRAYSISSTPLQKDYMDITVALVGEFTKKLWKAKTNDYLIFKGPFGKSHFTEDMKNDLVLISGGCGISPLMGIIRYCTEKKLQNKINLIYSARTPADVVYNEEFKKIREENRNFNYIVTITRPNPEHNWTGRTGRIDTSLLKENINNVENSLYFLCGPAEFVKSTISILESLGAKKEQIKTDVWG